jgi:hypothetical protein
MPTPRCPIRRAPPQRPRRALRWSACRCYTPLWSVCRCPTDPRRVLPWSTCLCWERPRLARLRSARLCRERPRRARRWSACRCRALPPSASRRLPPAAHQRPPAVPQNPLPAVLQRPLPAALRRPPVGRLPRQPRSLRARGRLPCLVPLRLPRPHAASRLLRGRRVAFITRRTHPPPEGSARTLATRREGAGIDSTRAAIRLRTSLRTERPHSASSAAALRALLASRARVLVQQRTLRIIPWRRSVGIYPYRFRFLTGASRSSWRCCSWRSGSVFALAWRRFALGAWRVSV